MLKKIATFAGLIISLFSSGTIMANPVKAEVAENGCSQAMDFTFRRLDKDTKENLCETYKNKVVMIVNTASKCGFTPQFETLEKLYDEYKDKGLVILGFPSNDFGGQDPGSEKEIASFCRLTYGVKFPMFEKTHAAKNSASPLYKTLGNLAGEYPKWNFHKYVLNTKGELIGSFPSSVKPYDKKLIGLIEKNLP